MSQNDGVLKMLREAGPAGLTPREALTALGCFRLAARIEVLRQAGHRIETTLERDGAGHRFARYVLTEDLTLGLVTGSWHDALPRSPHG